ncbi:hypothetical protein FNF27_01290 [Cafeteria roenbergensis]|uniref:Replication factor A protein 3 n=2 Tax=Cafeteria roenbergensis TaxID=33653 RepID=A0A5A8EHT4_CAFRO|nr:hypothetical protein FNF28_06629 [Cafeteria roenbergensis]KAA0159663.1 hypothetical protein FNF31_04739 [Cafeteria roenbergensis]KAA0177513.1 hypothetical protein FNF27_01290 [Cafeteria roenbergensis]
MAASGASSGDAAMPAVPRVNGAMLAGHQGKLVTLVGKITSVSGSTLTLEASDSESVTVHLLSDSALASGERPTDFVEIIGMVAEDGSVREQLAAFLPTGGTPFDLATYNEVVCLAADKFAPLFRD